MFNPMDYGQFSNACSRMYRNLYDMRAKTAVHYCTIQTLDKILESGFLRAVDSKFMNDLGEYQFGSEILKKGKYEKVKVSKVVPMTVSFSIESDLTPQWALYAKEIGIGIEFDFDFQRYWSNNHKDGSVYINGCAPTIAQMTEIDNFFIDTQIPYPLKIVYLNSSKPDIKKLQNLFEAIDHICSSNDPDYRAAKIEEVLPLAATFIKSDDFNYEKEARISTFAFERRNHRSKISFHANGTYLRPYVDICYIKNEYNPENIGWPIKTIWVGPGRNQKKAVESVIKRLEFGKVKTFDIPYKIFLERLDEYLNDMLKEIYKKYKNVKETDNQQNNLINKTVKDITKGLFSKNVMYCEFDGKKYHACIGKNNYKEVKAVLDTVTDKIIDKLVTVFMFKKKKTSELVAEYNEENYFSWYGIRVKASNRKFSFV